MVYKNITIIFGIFFILLLLSSVFSASRLTLFDISMAFAQTEEFFGDSDMGNQSNTGNLSVQQLSNVSNDNFTQLQQQQSPFANPKVELMNSSMTNSKLRIALTDGTVINSELTINPDASYSPNAPDIKKAKTLGNSAFGFRSNHKISNGLLSSQVQYFVPYSALPDTYVKLLVGNSSSSAKSLLKPQEFVPRVGEGRIVTVSGGVGEALEKILQTKVLGIKIDTIAEGGDLASGIYNIKKLAQHAANKEKLLDKLRDRLNNPDCKANLDPENAKKIVKEIEGAKEDLWANTVIELILEIWGSTTAPFLIPTVISMVGPNFQDLSSQEVQRVLKELGRFLNIYKAFLDFTGESTEKKDGTTLKDEHHDQFIFSITGDVNMTKQGPKELVKGNGKGFVDASSSGPDWQGSKEVNESLVITGEYNPLTKKVKLKLDALPEWWIVGSVPMPPESGISEVPLHVVNTLRVYALFAKTFTADVSTEGTTTAGSDILPAESADEIPVQVNYKLAVKPVC